MTYPSYSGGAPTYSSSSDICSGISGADSTVYRTYDNIGDVTQRVDGRGVTTAYTYSDPSNLLTGVAYTLPSSPPAGLVSTPNVSYTYDDFGRTSIADNGITRTTYGPSGTNGYDDDDNPLSIQTGYYNAAGTSILFSATLEYSYYLDGSRETESLGSSTFTSTYDVAGRPVGITNPFGETTTWSYYNNSWLASQVDNNSAASLVSTARYAYNDRGFLTDLANTGPTSSTISEFGSTNATSAMAYDAMGNRLSMIVNDAAASSYSGTNTYTYDNLDELTQEASTRNSGYTNNFAYDGAQNPTEFRGATISSANSDNQVPVTSQYSYDGAGNPTTYSSNSLVFDPENRMTAYGSAETDGYDALGLRAWTTTSAGTTYFLYDGEQPVMEINSSGTVTAVNTFVNGGLISRYSSSSEEFYAFDPQGSTAERVNSSGTVDTSFMTDAYGNTAASSSTSDPYSGFAAKWGYYKSSATGLELLGFRYYDPSAGRFISRDPISYLGGVNIYECINNKPTDHWDPSGLCPNSIIGGPGVYFPNDPPADGPAIGPDIIAGGGILQGGGAVGGIAAGGSGLVPGIGGFLVAIGSIVYLFTQFPICVPDLDQPAPPPQPGDPGYSGPHDPPYSPTPPGPTAPGGEYGPGPGMPQ